MGGKKERSKYCNQPSFLLVASWPIGPLERAQIAMACNMPTVELFVTDVKAWQKVFLDLEEWLSCHPDAPATTCVQLYFAVYVTNLLHDSWFVGYGMWYRPFQQLT